MQDLRDLFDERAHEVIPKQARSIDDGRNYGHVGLAYRMIAAKWPEKHMAHVYGDSGALWFGDVVANARFGEGVVILGPGKAPGGFVIVLFNDGIHRVQIEEVQFERSYRRTKSMQHFDERLHCPRCGMLTSRLAVLGNHRACRHCYDVLRI